MKTQLKLITGSIDVIQINGTDYASLNNISETAIILRDSAKQAALRGHNANLYGTIALGNGTINETAIQHLYIRLDRVFFFVINLWRLVCETYDQGWLEELATELNNYEAGKSRTESADDDELKHLVSLSKMHKTPVLAGIFARKLNDKYGLDIPTESKRTFGNHSPVS